VITLPFRAVGGLLGLVLRLTTAAVSLVLMAVGLLISLTVVGSVVGIPLFLLGLFVLWKSVVS
jgi:hypothetical protein